MPTHRGSANLLLGGLVSALASGLTASEIEDFRSQKVKAASSYQNKANSGIGDHKL
jgi:hypothetical protein